MRKLEAFAEMLAHCERAYRQHPEALDDAVDVCVSCGRPAQLWMREALVERAFAAARERKPGRPKSRFFRDHVLFSLIEELRGKDHERRPLKVAILEVCERLEHEDLRGHMHFASRPPIPFVFRRWKKPVAFETLNKIYKKQLRLVRRGYVPRLSAVLSVITFRGPK